MFEGYLELGGGEVLNSARALGYAKTAPCPVNWLQCPPCDGIRDVLGDDAYTYELISEAPWYDAEDEVTHRFLGAHAITVEGLPDSTREASVAESLGDGGVVGRVRHATRRTRYRAILTAQGEDALEAGFDWLSSALSPGKCGTHGDSCGAADSHFFTACPPTRAEITMPETFWNDPVENLATNPSFEAAGPATVVRTNLATNPSFEAATAATVEVARNYARNPSFEKPNGFATTLRTNLATNPSFEAATAATVAVRRNYAVNPSLEVDKSWWDNGPNCSATRTASPTAFSGGYVLNVVRLNATAGNCYFRTYATNLTPGKYTFTVRVRITAGAPQYRSFLATGAGAVISPGDDAIKSVPFNGANWVTITHTFTLTTGGTVTLTVMDDGSSNVQTGQAVDVDAAMLEQAPTAGPYFDGSTPAAGDFTHAWTGTPHASSSVEYGTAVPSADPMNQCYVVKSTAWSASGAASARAIPAGASLDTEGWVAVAGSPGIGMAGSGVTLVAGKTYTIIVKCRLAAPQTVTIYSARRINVVSNSVSGWAGSVDTYGDQAPNVAGVTELRLTVKIPDNAVWAGIRLGVGSGAGGGDVWWDDLLIVEGVYSGLYFDGSNPGKVRRNLALTPTLPAAGWPPAGWNLSSRWGGGSDWTTNTVNGVVTTGPSGTGITTCSRKTWSVAGANAPADFSFSLNAEVNIPVMPGETYTVSFWIRPSWNASDGAPVNNIQVHGFANASGGSVIWDPGDVVLPSLPANTWTRLSRTFTIPAGVGGISVYHNLYAGQTRPVVGSTLDATGLLVERGVASVGAFFDGAHAVAPYAAAWEGTANASPSYLHDPDFSYTWSGTGNASASLQRVVLPEGADQVAVLAGAFQSSHWAGARSKSIRIHPTRVDGSGTNPDTFAELNNMLPSLAGKGGVTYTIRGRIRLLAPQTSPVGNARQFRVNIGRATGSVEPVLTYLKSAPNTAGVHEVIATFTVPADVTGANFIRAMNGSYLDDVWWDELMFVEGVYVGPYFDGSTIPSTPDLSTAWAGTVDNSVSVLFGTAVETMSPGNGALPVASTEWASSGTKSMRLIMTRNDTTQGFVDFLTNNLLATFFKPSTVYTIMAKLRLAAPQTGPLDPDARSLFVHLNGGTYVDHATPGAQAPNVAGVHSLRGTFTTPASFSLYNTIRLMHGAHVGNGDVWWDDFQIIEGAYAGPYFDGSTPAAGDFTHAWTGTPHASTSTQNAPTVADMGVAAGSALAVQSTMWSDDRSHSVRIVPQTTTGDSRVSPGGDAGALRLGMEPGKTYTVSAVIHLEAPLTGALNPNDTRSILAIVHDGTRYIDHRSAKAPNEPGSYPISLTFDVPAGAGQAFIRLYNGAMTGNGDVWWDNFMLVEGSTYTGGYFDGALPDSTPEEYETVGTLVHEYEWTGTPDASSSTYRTGSVIAVPDPVAWQAAVDRMTRHLHTVTCVSGPIVEQKLHRGETWGYIVEFVLVAAVPWMFGVTRPVDLQPSLPVVVQDVPFNLVPYPSAELESGTVVAATNFSMNPSLEIDTALWAASGTMGAQAVMSRTTELASAGSGSARVLFTATAAGTNGWIGADHEVVLTGITSTTRYSVNLWAVASVQSGVASLPNVEVHAYWLNAAGAILRDDLIKSMPPSGGAASMKSILPPAGTAKVLVRSIAWLPSWNAGAVVRLYSDALAVTVP